MASTAIHATVCLDILETIVRQVELFTEWNVEGQNDKYLLIRVIHFILPIMHGHNSKWLYTATFVTYCSESTSLL